MILYNENQNKIDYLYSGNLKNNLFKIIDYQNLSNTIEMINRNLRMDLFIPQIELDSNDKLIRTFWEKNETFLIVYLQLPVAYSKSEILYDFIPIPYLNNTKLYMMNEETTSYFKTDSSFLLSEKTKSEYCGNLNDLTLCNSFIFEEIIDKHCIIDSIEGNKTLCESVQMPMKNYFVRISDTQIYAIIVKNVEILIQCPGKDTHLNLTRSQYISSSKNCVLFKYDNLSLNQTIVQMDMVLNLWNPNSNTYENPHSFKLEKIPIFNRTTLFNEINKRLRKVTKNATATIEEIEKISLTNSLFDAISSFWMDIKSFFSNTFIKYILTFMIIFTCFYFCLICVKKAIGKLFE